MTTVCKTFEHVCSAIVLNRRLTDEILSTTFCVVEQSLNERPLVAASSDATELKALTPNHFILGLRNSCLPFHSPNALDHRKRYVHAQAYPDAVWIRWLKECFPTLNP